MNNAVKDLESLLKIKKDLLADMLRCTQSAAESIMEEDMEAFERKLQRCEDIMRMVDELCAAEKALEAGAAGEKAALLKEEIEQIIKQLSEANAQCIKAAGEKLDSYGKKIRDLRQTKKGIGVYNVQPVCDAVFIDAKK